MLINAITYTFGAADADRAEAILHELRDAARTEPGCIRFEVGRSTSDPCIFVLWEEYDDQAALDAHYATKHFERLGINGIRPLAKDRVANICRAIA